MNVLVIEDHPLMQLGIRAIILENSPEANILHAVTFQEGLETLSRKKIEIVVLEIATPGGHDINMVKEILDKQHDVKILLNTSFDEKIYALPYLRAGAHGFISKSSPSDEFSTAWNLILQKKKYVSKIVQELLLAKMGDNRSSSSKNHVLFLSPREMKVMQLIGEGKWTKEIASILDLKENTVSTYKRRIYDKFKVKNELELAKKLKLYI